MDMFNRFKKFTDDFDSYKAEFDKIRGGGGRGCAGHGFLIGRGGRNETREERKNPWASMTKQSYDEIVKECAKTGAVFEDPEFEAVDSSVFYSVPNRRPFEWKRPGVVGGRYC